MGFHFVVIFIDSFMDDVTWRNGCWSLYVEYELLHTGVRLLWLWEFVIVTSAWWLCWTCQRHPTVLFRTSIPIWLPICGRIICFLYIDGIFFSYQTVDLLIFGRFVAFFWRSVVPSILLLLFEACLRIVWLMLTARQWPFRTANIRCDDLNPLTLLIWCLLDRASLWYFVSPRIIAICPRTFRNRVWRSLIQWQ